MEFDTSLISSFIEKMTESYLSSLGNQISSDLSKKTGDAILKGKVWKKVKNIFSREDLESKILQIEKNGSADAKDVKLILNSLSDKIHHDKVVCSDFIELVKDSFQAPKSYLTESPELSTLPITDSKLFGRTDELSFLDEAWINDNIRVVSIEAWGGVGKSALVNSWLNRLDYLNFLGAEKVFAWSFFSQGTRENETDSVRLFLNSALLWFGYEGDMAITNDQKVRTLKKLIFQTKTLLILDGMEPLQFPPGPLVGKLKNKQMESFIRGLARNLNGLCVITTRVSVSDLKTTDGHFSRTLKLKNLSPEASVSLLHTYDLRGRKSEFISASNEFGGHALALHLLGAFLKRFCNGILLRRNEVENISEDEESGGHAKRVMSSYVKWLKKENEAELNFLHILSLFDRPIGIAPIDFLLEGNKIVGFTDGLKGKKPNHKKIIISHLQELSLLAGTQQSMSSILDCHPLIREFFANRSKELFSDSWEEANARLFAYYSNLPTYELPSSIEEMEPLFQAIRHGCQAKKHTETYYNVYVERILHGSGEQYINRQLGGYHADLACLANFYESPFDPNTLNVPIEVKEQILNSAGFALMSIGRLDDAIPNSKMGMEISLDKRDLHGAGMDAAIVGECKLFLGDVTEALNYGELAIQQIDYGPENSSERFTKRALQGYMLLTAGRIEEAKKLFEETEELEKKHYDHAYMYALRGRQYCEVLLDQGHYAQVLERSQYSLNIVSKYGVVLGIALDLLTIGQALIYDPSLGKKLKIDTKQVLDSAIIHLRESERLNQLPLGLLARAIHHRIEGRYRESWIDLDEVLEVSEYGRMQLYLADYYIEVSTLLESQIQKTKKTKKTKKIEMIEYGETIMLDRSKAISKFSNYRALAIGLVKATKYFRRIPQIERLEKVSLK